MCSWWFAWPRRTRPCASATRQRSSRSPAAPSRPSCNLLAVAALGLLLHQDPGWQCAIVLVDGAKPSRAEVAPLRELDIYAQFAEQPVDLDGLLMGGLDQQLVERIAVGV